MNVPRREPPFASQPHGGATLTYDGEIGRQWLELKVRNAKALPSFDLVKAKARLRSMQASFNAATLLQNEAIDGAARELVRSGSPRWQSFFPSRTPLLQRDR